VDTAPHRRSGRFYGLYIIAACFFVLFVCWGTVLNTFPIFLKPIAEDMNWGRGALALSLLVGAIGTAVSAPIVGLLVDRIGARSVMAVGAAIVGLGVMAASRVAHLWQLYAVFAVMGCGLMGSTIIPCSLVISNWFVSRRGAAMSGAFAGTSVGGMVMSPIANWLILDYGWRTAFLFNGAFIVLMAVPVILLVIRTHPSEMGLEPYKRGAALGESGDEVWGVSVKEALSLPVFWQIAAIMLVMAVAEGGVTNHCVAYLTDLGHSPTRAAFAWSVLMGVMVLGKLASGPIADRWQAKNAMVITCLLLSVSIVILNMAEPYWAVLLFATIFGFATGAPLVLNALLTGNYMGMRNFGAIYGVLNILLTVGGAAGPVGTGIFFDSQKTYLPVFYFFAALMLVIAAVSMLLKPEPHRVAGAGRSPRPAAAGGPAGASDPLS
jgi:MFS family permease